MALSVQIDNRRRNMPIVNRWFEYLDRMGVAYSHSTHPQAWTATETASAERIPAHEFAKTVVYRTDAGFGMAVVPADHFVDLARLAAILGVDFVRLANEMEIAELFPGCELGAMPPFGPAFDMPVLVDANIAGGFVAFNIGTHRDVARMSYADFRRLAKPTVAPITAMIEAGEEVLI
jgi:Ala-tRNA(Pro) deacylase